MSEQRHIGYQEAVDALTAVVNANLDRRTEYCQYFMDDENLNIVGPDCVVGHWVDQLNLPRDEFIQHNGAALDELFESLDTDDGEVVKIDGFTLDWEAASLLETAQLIQDGRSMYEDLIDEATGERPQWSKIKDILGL